MYKSTGADLLHTRVLRTLEDMLCGPLNHVFNKSAENGIIPEDLKYTIVTYLPGLSNVINLTRYHTKDFF